MNYRKGYDTGFEKVVPIGDESDMYIVPGHDPMAGFKIASYMSNEEGHVLDGSQLAGGWTAKHIWVTEETKTITESYGDDTWEEEAIEYTFWASPGQGRPYTAIGDWDAYALKETL